MKKIVRPSAFPIVAIGASAGGLKAFAELLNALPREPGMAFVLVPHLSPLYKSHLSEILARGAKIPVGEAKARERIAPNRIYVIPSNRAMNIKEGVLHLFSTGRKSDWRNPIDSFFRSLAADQGKKAIGVLLSGEGTDGTEGLRAIKEAGGKTFAQDGSAAHRSMPHSAAAAGCVDFVLSPAEIGAKLGSLPAADARAAAGGRARAGGDGLSGILDFLHDAKGIDFSFYKKSTLRRRVQRRMTAARLRDPERYLRALKADPKEVDLLFADILISVTSFFREPESFQALKTTIYPRLLKGRAADAPIRIWIPGCSTGEEAYSHAMNLVEFLGKEASRIPIQIFATDVNPAAIAKARAAHYTRKMTAGVSAERLRRFFVETADGGYRIAPAIRERCVFAAHNLVQDPPFTNLEMISCRNLLIYMGSTLQETALQIFQYALKPRGILMLGRSEAIGEFSGRFLPLNTKGKVFSERTEISKAPLDFNRPGRFLEAESGSLASSGSQTVKADAGGFDLQGPLDGVLPARYAPCGVVVNAELEILRFLGNASAYLRPASGKSSLNLRRMASGEFLLELRASIVAAKRTGGAVRKEIAAPHSSTSRVRVEVLPIKRASPNGEYFLVLFEEAASAGPAPRKRANDSRNMLELKEDLAVSGEHLKAIIEEQESTNARLKSSNEELLSSNEELQSINEEFETTKEELQSSNEELITSTEEVGRGNQVLSRANNDLSNLLANIDIPVVLLDPDLTIHRFTPAAAKTLGLSPDKIGKSVVGLELPLRLSNLKELLLKVIKTGHVQTHEVQSSDGRWYYLILRPYRTDKSRTEKSRTEGAVMALIDIHERKVAEKTVQRLATVVLDSNDSIIIVNLEDRIIAWNKGAHKMYGYTETDALGMSVMRLMPEDTRVRARDLVRVSAAPIETRRRTKDGRILEVLTTVTVLRDEAGEAVEVAITDRDITEQKGAERDRKLSEKTVLRLATSVFDSNDAVIIRDLEDRIVAWNKGAQKMYGYSEAEALKMSLRRLMPGNTPTRTAELLRLDAQGKKAPPIETQRRTKNGRMLDVLLTVTLLRDDKGLPVEFATTERDITEQKRAERERKASEKNTLRLANSVLDSNDAVIICDLKDRILAWNKGAQKMYGYTEAEALSMSINRLMPGNKRIKAQDLVRVSAAPVEAQRRTKGGRILDVQITVTVLRDGDGQPVEVATTERDITEQKRAERERKASEKNVLRLANSVLDSNDAVIICDLKDRILAWNKGAQKMYGYTEAEALSMSIIRLMPENRRIKAQDLVRVSAAPIEIQRRTKGGGILDVLITVTVLRDGDGQPVEVATTERDITEHKRAEREREASEKNVLRLANSVLDSNDAVIICDLKDRILAWNKGAHKMYGYTEAEALAMSINRLMPGNKRIKAQDLVRVSAAPIEAQRRTKGGRILDVQITVTVLRDGTGQPVEVATTERDITDLKLADREFRRLHASVISAQETERKRLSRELHDGVGQILSGVKFRLQALPGQMTLSGGAEAKILKVGGFLDHAIAEIRRVSQNLMPSELVDLGLGPALSTLCREFKERSGVHVTVRDEGVPTDLPSDMALALFRISQEALNNIGKHAKATMVVVSLTLKGKEVALSVSDNGVGFKLDGPRQPAGRGFGLGNMRQRAESVGGSIELHSTPGAGTTLSIRAPLSGLGGYTA